MKKGPTQRTEHRKCEEQTGESHPLVVLGQDMLENPLEMRELIECKVNLYDFMKSPTQMGTARVEEEYRAE